MQSSPSRTSPARAVTCVLLLGLAASVGAAQSSQPASGSQAPAATDGALGEQIKQLIAAPEVARAHWGIAVTSLAGAPLVAIDADKLFHPASNAKLFTTVAGIALLGPEATVSTRIEARGPITNGVLTGDLALVGAGDANFASDDTPYRPPAAPGTSAPPLDPHPLRALEAVADAVLAAGVHTVTGDILGDDTRFAWEPYPEDWANDDLLWEYGAPVSALSVHDNQIALRIQPGAAPGAPAAVAFEHGMPAWFTLDTTALTTAEPKSGTHVEIGPVPGEPRTLRLWGAIAADAPDDTEEIAIPEPALFAAEALRAMLQFRGITVTGTARAVHRLPLATASLREQAHQPLGPVACDGCVLYGLPTLHKQTLATTASPTLLADEIATNKLSQNLHAELLLERLGANFGLQDHPQPGELAGAQPLTTADPASRAQGVRVVRSILPLAGIEPEDVILVDGSGLSSHDLVTPRSLVHLLTWASTQPWSAAWRSTLPVGGVDGTLAGRFLKPPLLGRVHAKTGTLGEARALSGYLTCQSGRVVAFSILVDNHIPGSAADRDTTDHILAALYAAL